MNKQTAKIDFLTQKWFTGLKTDHYVFKHINQYAVEENGSGSSQRNKIQELDEKESQKS